MNARGILFATSLLSMGAMAVGSGCGSSSSSGSKPDAGASNDSGDDGSSGNSCSPVGGSMCPPGMGLTCCVDVTGLAGAAGGGGANLGSCVAPSSCSSMIQYQCMVPTDCASGQVCCGGVGGDAGGLLAALADAGDASFDAASLMAAADGGALGGLGGALSGLSIQSFCQASCMASQYQLCASDGDCKNAGASSVCGPASLAALGGGAGGFASLLSGFIMIKTCQAPEGGTTTEAGVEAGGGDSGGSSNDGSAPDSGASDGGAG